MSGSFEYEFINFSVTNLSEHFEETRRKDYLTAYCTANGKTIVTVKVYLYRLQRHEKRRKM